MKQVILTFFLTLNILTAIGQDMTKEELKVVNDFIDCIKNHKTEKLISKILFPIVRETPIPPIKNRQEFISRYKEVFDDNLTKIIINSNPSKDWSPVGWRGIMLLNGDVWLSYEGKLIAINYQSKAEAKIKEELISQDKKQLHESIKDFKRPIHILQTSKFLIRIDEVKDGIYRYASWKLGSKMSDKPDLLILKGEFIPDGSGGNHSYQFKNGKYTYECYIEVMGKEYSTVAGFSILKEDKLILSQKAKIMNK